MKLNLLAPRQALTGEPSEQSPASPVQTPPPLSPKRSARDLGQLMGLKPRPSASSGGLSGGLNRQLRRAASTGDLDLLKQCLEAGANPNARSPVRQHSAMHCAASSKHELAAEVVKELLVGGGNRWDRSFTGQTPLQMAIEQHRDDLVGALTLCDPPDFNAGPMTPPASPSKADHFSGPVTRPVSTRDPDEAPPPFDSARHRGTGARLRVANPDDPVFGTTAAFEARQEPPPPYRPSSNDTVVDVSAEGWPGMGSPGRHKSEFRSVPHEGSPISDAEFRQRAELFEALGLDQKASVGTTPSRPEDQGASS